MRLGNPHIQEMRSRFTAFTSAMALAALVGCGGDSTPSRRAPARPDSSSGDVAQYELMKNHVGWLTDSNIVALAAQLNDVAPEISRLEMQEWTKEPYRYLASEILKDHAALQNSLDSIARLRHLPAQMPAVAPEIKAPYDSLLGTQAGLPLAEREAQFVDMVLKVHGRAIVDFGALAGNATDPDLRALLANRAVLMEQTHIARARLIQAAIARDDSVRQDSLKARKGRQ
jgi:hypothetical protein